ncbi:hypothetical protein QUW03_04595 [Faecalicoccus acidiformans]|uniref:lipopolysaccharide biosynthesis protein n=1 Tax=Faecalicoccus acidiformans TaxID=915173 RepID=UPI0025A3C770|nr:hypothetical protein [Faecalicoccus acidiformans]MDM8203647.1 hypothetical protein [Faecalicoccus acidiformans]
MNNRIKTVYLNSIVTFGCQILQILLGFIVRKIFIDSLGTAYLGYNSVFLNILQLLNLADMGIGVAITSFLFEPLARGDRERVSALMYLYKRIYNIMGFIVLVIGLLISLFLDVLIPDATCSIGYLRLLFYINLAGTVSTYFLAYKRTLIIADQKSYITNFVDLIVYIVASCAQILCLIVFPNYILYLLFQIGKNVVSNIILSVQCNKIYGSINNNISNEIVKEYKPQIIRYVKDVFVSRLGATIFYGTDNVIISVFRGSLLAGYLSNYTMITTQLTTVFSQVLTSSQATFGNYIHSGRNLDEQRIMADNYYCVNFIIGNFCMICFTLLVQPFISLFFGKSFILPFSSALLLGVNLMLTMLIQLPSQVFIIYKLFHYDRPIIIVSAILNIFVSAILVNPLGIDGVLIGTFITSLIYLFSRFYIISKYAYKISYRHYLVKNLLYFLISVTCFVSIAFICGRIPGDSIICFIIRIVVVVLMAMFIPLICLSFTNEYKFLSEKLLPDIIKKYTNKYILLGVCIVVIMVELLFDFF